MKKAIVLFVIIVLPFEDKKGRDKRIVKKAK